jgi:hypothetical protein
MEIRTEESVVVANAIRNDPTRPRDRAEAADGERRPEVPVAKRPYEAPTLEEVADGASDFWCD